MFGKVISAVVTLGILVLLVAPAFAEDVKLGALQISAPWARATPKGATIGGGYLKVTNTGGSPDRLTGGASPISDKVEIHAMSMANDIMKMRPVSGGLEIRPGQTVEFKPSGLHVMFVGLKQPLQQGQRFKATLTFEKAGRVDVDFSVAGIGAMTGAMTGGDHATPAMPGGDHGGTHMK